MDELLTIRQVSERLKTNVSTVYQLINEGQLPALKVGALKVRAITLDQFLAKEESRQNPDKQARHADTCRRQGDNASLWR